MNGSLARRMVAVSTSVVLVGGSAACGNDAARPSGRAEHSAREPTSTPGPSANSPSATGSPSAGGIDVPFEEQRRILDQYAAYFPAVNTASTLPEAQRRDYLDDYATNPSLDRNLDGLIALDAKGLRLEGRKILHPTLVSVKEGVALVSDCVDGSNDGQVDIATGEKRRVGRQHTAMETQLRKGKDGVWRVSGVRFPRRSC